MKKQTIILKIFGHVPAVARGGGIWINLVSTILQYSGKKYWGAFWVIILSVRYLQYFFWYFRIFWEIHGTKYQVWDWSYKTD